MLTYLYILNCIWSTYLILSCPHYRGTTRTMMDFILTVFIKARPKSTKWAYTDATEYRSTDSIPSNFICHMGCNYVLTARALNLCWKHASLSWWRKLLWRCNHDRPTHHHNLLLLTILWLTKLWLTILWLSILWLWWTILLLTIRWLTILLLLKCWVLRILSLVTLYWISLGINLTGLLIILLLDVTHLTSK
jgi:hypothetical protein